MQNPRLCHDEDVGDKYAQLAGTIVCEFWVFKVTGYSFNTLDHPPLNWTHTVMVYRDSEIWKVPNFHAGSDDNYESSLSHLKNFVPLEQIPYS